MKQVVLLEDTYVIKAGEKVGLSFRVDMAGEEISARRFRLQLRGAVGIQASLMYEGGLPYLYRDIDDALSEETHHSRFSLKIRTAGEDYPRRAYYRIDCPPRINSQYAVPESRDTKWHFCATVKTKDFYVEEEGKAEVRFSCYVRKGPDGPENPHIPGRMEGEPKICIAVPFPRGNSGWAQIEGTVPIDARTEAVLVTVAAEKTSGTVWLEDFSLTNDTGFNILPPFDLANRYHPFANWMGENLSEKEWTKLGVTLNGKDLGVHQLFQRCFAGAENEISLPEGALQPGENILILENMSDYFCPAPYILSRLALHREVNPPVRIVFCPAHVEAGKEFGILLRTRHPQAQVSLGLGSCLKAPEKFFFPEAGLQIIQIQAGNTGYLQEVTITADGVSDTAWVERIVEKEEDGVLTGSGDAVYIPQEKEEMEDFLCWYLSEHLGNMITFRPVYRWSGSRTCHPEVWKRLVQLCRGLQLKYCYISDGRELPGINANPSEELLKGEGFLGSQGHERDGAFYYWLQTARMGNETLFEQVCRLVCHHPDYNYRTPLEYGPEGVYYNFSPVKCLDMEEGAVQFVNKIRASLTGIRRHTGPSVLFRYFYQAGVEVCGAELMYGPTEVILSALRGASAAYGRKVFTAHLAVQWSTTPHDSPAHFRRFRLALFISYLQGCHHINTEEGFYRMEELFAVSDRFSDSCRGHAQVQQEFLRFVQTHSRRGEMVNPIALLHGANDAWVCFTRRNAWSQEGEQWKFDTPEESWDLLKVFYPDSVLDAVYRHPCPDSPQGYYSRTPYTTVDILPVEASVSTYRRYGHLAFCGYNTAEKSQVEKLYDFVKEGGKLLLGWCHLLTDKDRRSAVYGTSLPLDAKKLTGVSLHCFYDKRDGLTLGKISGLCSQVTVLKEREGIPLLLKHCLGKGEVYLVNAREYPAVSGIRDIYEEVLQLFGWEAAEENAAKGWLSGRDTVEAAVYDRTDGHRVIYAVNTDWWSKPVRTAYAFLRLAGCSWRIPVPGDRITQITINGDIAVVVSDMETEVLEILRKENGCTLRLQGDKEACVTLYSVRHPVYKGKVLPPGNGGYSLKLMLQGRQDCEIGWEE